MNKRMKKKNVKKADAKLLKGFESFYNLKITKLHPRHDFTGYAAQNLYRKIEKFNQKTSFSDDEFYMMLNVLAHDNKKSHGYLRLFMAYIAGNEYCQEIEKWEDNTETVSDIFITPYGPDMVIKYYNYYKNIDSVKLFRTTYFIDKDEWQESTVLYEAYMNYEQKNYTWD